MAGDLSWHVLISSGFFGAIGVIIRQLVHPGNTALIIGKLEDYSASAIRYL